MKRSINMIIRKFDEGFNLELDNKKKNISFSSCNDFADYLFLDVTEVKNMVEGNKGTIISINLDDYNEFSYKDKDNKMDIIHFSSKEDCLKLMDLFYEERKISVLLNDIKSLEKKYGSKEEHTREDVKSCYEDDYILGIWDIEKYTEESGEGFFHFEDFLLSFIEQNLIFE